MKLLKRSLVANLHPESFSTRERLKSLIMLNPGRAFGTFKYLETFQKFRFKQIQLLLRHCVSLRRIMT